MNDTIKISQESSLFFCHIRSSSFFQLSTFRTEKRKADTKNVYSQAIMISNWIIIIVKRIHVSSIGCNGLEDRVPTAHVFQVEASW